jgi:outer membrane receptor protein involved in Fe transport
MQKQTVSVFRLTPFALAIQASLGLITAGFVTPSFAQPTQSQSVTEVNVTGTSAPLTKVTDDIESSPASVTVLGRKELDRKTISTYGDIYRGLAGVSVAEYGQGLVAYEIKFRGFTSGHGRDVATYLDGVPLNITGSQHTNGYMDQAQIIPELIDRIELVRGPFSTYAGNHALAGSIQMFTDRNVATSFKVNVDSFGRVRALPIYSSDAGPGKLLLALEATKGSGYTKQSDLERTNLFVRYALPVADGTLALRFQNYRADAQAPGYLDLARIEAGQINKRDALNLGIGDRKNQSNIVLNYRSDDLEGVNGLRGGWTSSIYAVRDKRERFTNFDISLPSFSKTNIGAEQDKLQQMGVDVRKVTMLSSGNVPVQLAVGAQYNRERINALNYTADFLRQYIAPTAALPDTVGVDRSVLTTTQSVYGQLQMQPVSALKLSLGLRYDKLDFGSTLNPRDDTYASANAVGLGNAINTSASRLSPKIGAALKVFDNKSSSVELYANSANGLKSPYAFSDFYGNVTANSGAVPNLTVSTLRSNELGLKGSALQNSLKWRVGLWDTRQDREVERNSAGFVQSFGKTNRKGFDAEATAKLGADTQAFINYSQVKARSLTAAAGSDFITNVPEWTAAVGVATTVNLPSGKLTLVAEDSLVGPQSITTDNQTRGSTYNRLSLRASFATPALKGTTFYAGLVSFNKQYQEPRFDFGGGAVGVSPRPKLAINVGTQINF